MSRRVALATYELAPALAPGDQLLAPALAKLGVHAEPLVWSNSDAPWQDFDTVIIRSCWDYHLRFGEFLAWLDRLAASGVVVWNSSSLVRWNAHKRYLLDLAQRGVATIPTLIVPRGGADDVGPIVAAQGWTRFVLKPVVSASGYETHAFETPLTADAIETIARVTALGDILLQPFATEVARDGEYSFIFIDGEFSHAALRRAPPSDFRVQPKYGGTVERVDAPAALVMQAAQAIRVLPERPLYARVDGIARDGAFLLMELELIEPNLFLGESVGAADRFARAIVDRLG